MRDLEASIPLIKLCFNVFIIIIITFLYYAESSSGVYSRHWLKCNQAAWKLIWIWLLLQTVILLEAIGNCPTNVTRIASTKCPPPWMTWGDHCYLSISRPVTDFYYSGLRCRDLSKPWRAYLASVTSEEEYDFMWSYASAAGNQFFWIGYRYNNGFFWTDGTANTDVSFASWVDGDPDQGLRDRKSFDDAENHCRDLSNSGRPAHLASVTSAEENRFINEYATASQINSGGFWIGYKYEGGFSWTDGTADTGFSNWVAGAPDHGLGTGRNCTVVKVDGRCRSIERNTGCPYPWRAWGDDCYLSVSHIAPNFYHAEDHCQSLSNPGRPAHLASVTSDEENQFIYADATASGINTGFWIGYRNDGGFSWTDDHCYLSVSHLADNFYHAEDHCQGLSKPGRPAHLASVTSDGENQFIYAYATASGIKTDSFWIGYRYDGGFSWTDGTADTGFSNWVAGAADHGLATGRRCVNTVLKVDGRCRSIERNTGCPYPWRAWGDHCYLSVSLKNNFNQAENHCQSLSNPGRLAHLASVTSDEENQFIYAYAKASGVSGFWIGYSYSGGFSWTDGSSTGFSSWHDGHPNTGVSNGWNCVIVYDIPWSLQWCTNPRNSVCKMARIA
ncbi:macrophage mannose receptor 1-like [Patiria miniata]|uniref:C-type lectin domain-containing protein n=1 Tax=Patiria miniata TaxID=46514 RepID=A0A913ZMY3_PATMI|nr:macrophage mannose receptor 1-like [Patiria miniata]